MLVILPDPGFASAARVAIVLSTLREESEQCGIDHSAAQLSKVRERRPSDVREADPDTLI